MNAAYSCERGGRITQLQYFLQPFGELSRIRLPRTWVSGRSDHEHPSSFFAAMLAEISWFASSGVIFLSDRSCASSMISSRDAHADSVSSAAASFDFSNLVYSSSL